MGIINLFKKIKIPIMLHYLLVFNRSGKNRLAKWYVPYNDDERQKLILEIYRIVNTRDGKFTNFVEFRNEKLVYRRYAGLYFAAIVSPDDNELAYLEAIHLFVEVLDAYFGNVCELDLVFNFYKVYEILDEMFTGGEIMETSKPEILNRMDTIDRVILGI